MGVMTILHAQIIVEIPWAFPHANNKIMLVNDGVTSALGYI